MRVAFTAAIAIAATTGLASAQGETGFLRGKGKLDAVLSVNYDSSDEFFLGPSPLAPPISGVERTIYSLYAAYGVTDRIDGRLRAERQHSSGFGVQRAHGLCPRNGLLGALEVHDCR